MTVVPKQQAAVRFNTDLISHVYKTLRRILATREQTRQQSVPHVIGQPQLQPANAHTSPPNRASGRAYVGNHRGGMAYFLAVANRKGGVGKSTISVMLAQAFAVWGGKRVLMLDLDSQCNASLILVGGQGWRAAREANKTIADFFYDLFDGIPAQPRDYLIPNVGDVADQTGKAPRLTLLPGSLLLEDIQGELFVRQAKESNNPDVVASRVRGRIENLLRRYGASYDLVILDCPPGLSLAALAALKTADKVLVPFKPDYVSQLAVDRIALLIEDKGTLDSLSEIPPEQRRYVCLANGVRTAGKDRMLVEEIGLFHPMLATQLPQKDSIANAFDWTPALKSIEAKYGDGIADLKRLYDELVPMVDTAARLRSSAANQ